MFVGCCMKEWGLLLPLRIICGSSCSTEDFETKRGKWVRETIFYDPALMHAMKTWIYRKMHSIVKDKDDPEAAKYFVAEHACKHLNSLLAADPTLISEKSYAAEVPVKLKTMQVWMRTVFGHQWRRNAKGTANQMHERDDALQQRIKHMFDNRDRELQGMMWHHIKLDDLKEASPHTHELALKSRRLAAETDMMEKKLGDATQAELMHNVHVHCTTEIVTRERMGWKDGDLAQWEETAREATWWVEYHVDFLEINHRIAACPCWGGALSVRINKAKVSAFLVLSLSPPSLRVYPCLSVFLRVLSVWTFPPSLFISFLFGISFFLFWSYHLLPFSNGYCSFLFFSPPPPFSVPSLTLIFPEAHVRIFL